MKYKIITKKQKEEEYRKSAYWHKGVYMQLKETPDPMERMVAKEAFMVGVYTGERLTCTKYALSQHKYNSLKLESQRLKKAIEDYKYELKQLKILADNVALRLGKELQKLAK